MDCIDTDNDEVVDIGSGAGLPCIRLAIAWVISIKLIEPRQKQVVLKSLAEINECDPNLVVSRAVRSLNNLLGGKASCFVWN